MRLVAIPPYRNPAVEWGWVLRHLLNDYARTGALDGVEVDVDEGYLVESTSERRDEEVLALINVGIINRVKEYAATGKYHGIVLTGGIDPGFIAARVVLQDRIPVTGAIHSALHVASLIGAVRSRIQASAPDIPVYNESTMEALVSRSLDAQRFQVWLLGIFAATALLLSALGIYGVMSHAVGQRTREIGIRMALGATAGGVIALVIRQGMRQVLVGCVLGIAGAAGAFMLIRGVLYGAGSLTAATFVGAPLVLLAVAALALLVPARRAARLDSVVALRQE